MEMNFDDEEEWDLDFVENLVRKEEEAIAARRGSQAVPLSPQPSLPLLRAASRRGPEKRSRKTQEEEHEGHAFPGPPPKEEKLVCELRQRLLQAEQELNELRKKAVKPIVVTSSTTEQELERLRAQILFKDQEILEARRAGTEKSEQLRRVISEVEELRKGSEERKQVKWQSEPSAQVKHREEGRRDDVPRISKTSRPDIAGSQGSQDQDLWYPPWRLSGPPELLQGASKLKNTSPEAIQSQSTSLDREDPSIVGELKYRTLDNGCTSSNQKEIKSGSSQLQQEETARPSTYDRNNQSKKETIIERATENRSWEHICPDKLLKIWCSGNMRGESLGLLSKIFTVCQADMKVLLSMDVGGAGYRKKQNKHMGVSKTNANVAKETALDSFVDRTEVDLGGSGEPDLYSILAKMASGLVSSWNFFMAVLEICESDNMRVSESALRVLHCILIHDESCQNELFRRNSLQPPVKNELQKLVTAESLSKDAVDSHVGSRAFRDLLSTASPMHVFKAYLSSPRVYWYTKVSSGCQINEQDMSHKKCRIFPMTNGSPQEEYSGCTSFAEGNYDTWLSIIFARILFKAVKGSSQAVRITAMSILVVLVLNTEPIDQRKHFGFILFDGSIASLLRKSAGLDVRLQAVRLVHIVLHCPPVLRKLCAAEEELPKELAPTVLRQGWEVDGHIQQDLECNSRPEEVELCLQKGKQVESHSDAAERNAERNSRIELLEGLISCLLHVGSSFKTYSLQRNALRVLTFIATSGQKGAAFLLAKKVDFAMEGNPKEAKEGDKDKVSPAIILGSLPVHLIALLDQELKAEEEEETCFVKRKVEIEERECVIHEALTLLCRLASHPVKSSTTLMAITADKAIARLSISVTNRLISRGALSEAPKLQDKRAVSATDMIELSRGLRRRILASVSNL